MAGTRADRSAACQRPSRSVASRRRSGRPGPPRPGTAGPRPARRRRLHHARQVGGADAGQRHPRGRRQIQPTQRQHGRRPARLQRAGQGRASPPSSSRRVPTHSTRSAARLSARYSSSASVSRSAQCRSSSEQAAGLAWTADEQPQHGLTQEDKGVVARLALLPPLAEPAGPGRAGTDRAPLTGRRPARAADASASANGRKAGDAAATARPARTQAALEGRPALPPGQAVTSRA